MTKLLIIEDDMTLNDGIVLALKQPDYSFTQCYCLKTAYEAIKKHKYDLIILDINLPDGSGYDFLRKVREEGQTPVLILTANDLEMNEVMGFELGADDYVTKPFRLAVLRLRIVALLKRRLPQKEVYETGSLHFDFSSMQFYKGEEELQLSLTEQKLLRILVENAGNTLKRSTLVDKIWTDGAEYVDENALSVAVKRLRGKIEENPASPKYIHTVYGIGYVWRVEE